MPTKFRKERKALRIAYMRKLDQAVRNVPEHLLGRIGSLSPISKNLKETGGYGWGGYQYELATGQAIKLKNANTKHSANLVRRRDREVEINHILVPNAVLKSCVMVKRVSHDKTHHYNKNTLQYIGQTWRTK